MEKTETETKTGKIFNITLASIIIPIVIALILAYIDIRVNIENRLTKLESNTTEIKQDISEIKTQNNTINGKLDYVIGWKKTK